MTAIKVTAAQARAMGVNPSPAPVKRTTRTVAADRTRRCARRAARRSRRWRQRIVTSPSPIAVSSWSCEHQAVGESHYAEADHRRGPGHPSRGVSRPDPLLVRVCDQTIDPDVVAVTFQLTRAYIEYPDRIEQYALP